MIVRPFQHINITFFAKRHEFLPTQGLVPIIYLPNVDSKLNNKNANVSRGEPTQHQRFAKETHFFPRPSTNGEAHHLVSSVFGHPRIKIVVSHSSFGRMAASSLQPRWTRGIEECFNYRRRRARAFSIKFEKKYSSSSFQKNNNSGRAPPAAFLSYVTVK